MDISLKAFSAYILYSETSQRHYIGHSDDVTRRVKQHNDPNYLGSLTTKRFSGPWELIWSETCASRSEAMQLERKIKKRGAKRFLDSL